MSAHAHEATPDALIKRIQHALLDMPVLDLGEGVGRVALAQAGQVLPASPGYEDVLAASEPGVFREMPTSTGPCWLLWSHLDTLPSVLSPLLDSMDRRALDTLSVTLAFQVGMSRENARSQRRSSHPR